MGYVFHGFFARADEQVLRAALARWPQCRGRMVAAPFVGIGVACPDFRGIIEFDDYERALELIGEVEDGLPAWSAEYPDVTFVYIEANCVGGTCAYDGYVCRNGEVLDSEDSGGKSREEWLAGLKRLLSWLGVQTRDGAFEPFRRGYFD